MVESLGYPREMLCVEKQLSSIPHLLKKNTPNRRFDIICFAKGIHEEHEIYPLLMIECKAHLITKKAIEQVIGYNDYVSAFFIAIANQERVIIGWKGKDNKGYQFSEGLPCYDEIYTLARSKCNTKKRKSAQKIQS